MKYIDYENNIVRKNLLIGEINIIPLPKSIVENKLFKTPRQPLYKNISRNEPCPCGSGKKFKKCCIDKFE